jgi:hypothetical protein
MIKSREKNPKCEFTNETNQLIKNLLAKLVENETESELWRKKLNNMPMFNTKNLFNSIIKYNDQYILFSDIENYFQKSDMGQDEILLVFSLFDKNRDNKISYHEVCNNFI